MRKGKHEMELERLGRADSYPLIHAFFLTTCLVYAIILGNGAKAGGKIKS